MPFLARLSRIVPGLIILLLIAGVVYLVMLSRYSQSRAKEVLIRVFLAITIALSAGFGLITLYALLDHNALVLDLGFWFLATALICLGVVLICRAVFFKNHPEYRKKAQRTKTHRRWFSK